MTTSERTGMGKHSLPGIDGIVREPGEPAVSFFDAIPVAVLLEQAVARGDALRLAWSMRDIDPRTGLVQPFVDDLPTGVLPVIRDDTIDPRDS